MHFQSVMRFDTPTARLRAVAFVEGSSFLLLLFVAMPLKYFADLPLAVRIVGLVHGVLFIGLALQALAAVRTRGKSLGWGARLGVAALLPFGTYFCDRGLAADDEAFRQAKR